MNEYHRAQLREKVEKKMEEIVKEVVKEGVEEADVKDDPFSRFVREEAISWVLELASDVDKGIKLKRNPHGFRDHMMKKWMEGGHAGSLP